jgi:hypothetical protein
VSNPTRFFFVVIAVALIFCASSFASVTVIDFESEPPMMITNVNPINPWIESGFMLNSSNASSAVFGAGSLVSMPGDSTSFLGWASGNTITLSATNSSPFDLISLDLGITTLSLSSSTDITLVGTPFGGGTPLTITFTGLTTTTHENVNWSNLSSVTFNGTTDSGMDNINVSPVPEPGTWMLLACGAALLLPISLRRAHS